MITVDKIQSAIESMNEIEKRVNVQSSTIVYSHLSRIGVSLSLSEWNNLFEVYHSMSIGGGNEKSNAS